jgi:dUTP pyrophosphatase
MKEDFMKRGFEKVSHYNSEDVLLPTRSTKGSAGYDFYASEDTVIPTIWKAFDRNSDTIDKPRLASTLVPTGIKAFMPEDEFLMLVNRSSSPMKRQLTLPNGVGVIDSDYYNNESNEGEVFMQLLNYGAEDYLVEKGDRICQGIFMPYYTILGEESPNGNRSGGFGSSGN